MDVLWGFAGPVEELKHHRGITHTFLAAPVVAGGRRRSGLALPSLAPKRERAANRPPHRLQTAAGRRRTPASRSIGFGSILTALDCRAQPSAARLDQQLRPASVFPLQSTLVRRQFCFHRRAGALGAASARALAPALALRAHRRRNRRAPQTISRPWMGHLRVLRHGPALGLALVPSTPAPCRCLRPIQVTARPGSSRTPSSRSP